MTVVDSYLGVSIVRPANPDDLMLRLSEVPVASVGVLWNFQVLNGEFHDVPRSLLWKAQDFASVTSRVTELLAVDRHIWRQGIFVTVFVNKGKGTFARYAA